MIIIQDGVYVMFQYKDQEYEGVHFEGRDLRYGELISCVFKQCTFMKLQWKKSKQAIAVLSNVTLRALP